MIDEGTISADGDTTISVTPIKQIWQGWKRRLYAYGTWGGGTLTLQRTADGGTTMIDVGTLSANGVIDFDALPDEEYNLNMAGSTTPDVDWKVF